MKNYFGTDGIRFIYSEEIKVFIYKLASVIENNKKIIIGCDTRYSSEEIVSILMSKLKGAEFVGIISTPGISYLSKKHHCLGIMVTASHNPYQYNGIKIFDKGLKLSKKKQILLSNLIDLSDEKSYQKTNIKVNEQYYNEYLSFLKKYLIKSKYKIGFDVANGVCSNYIKEISQLINPNNKVFFASPNGKNINDNNGAINPSCLQNLLKEHHLDYGFCFDGDADRLIMVNQEKIFNGDELLYILATRNKVKKVVVTEITNLGLIESLKRKNIEAIVVKVGDQNILECLKKKKLSLGGETSGHIIDYKKLKSGDALLNALNIISLLNKYSISELLDGYNAYQEKLISLEVNNKEIINDKLITNLIDNLTAKFNIYINIRKSGTENKIRIYFCAKEKEVIEYTSNKLITYLKLLDYQVKYESLNVLIDEKTILGKNVTLKGHCILKNALIKDNVIIQDSYIEDSEIGFNTIIGPYSHIRNQSVIKNNIRIGNFVEIKKSIIDDNCKIAHLTYIGDCKCGKDVNFGCGTVICNYDGKNKHQTIIGNKVFIGCNVNLIAPIEIEDHCFIAAGSTLTTSLKSNTFAIARAKQIIKEDKANLYPYF